MIFLEGNRTVNGGDCNDRLDPVGELQAGHLPALPDGLPAAQVPLGPGPRLRLHCGGALPDSHQQPSGHLQQARGAQGEVRRLRERAGLSR